MYFNPSSKFKIFNLKFLLISCYILNLLDVNLENSHEDTDEGRTSMKRILQSCLDGNVENFLFHLKNEIGGRKHLLLKTDQNGWNVMHFAAKGGNLKIFQLLQSQDLDVCTKTHDQMTVLHIATQSGHYDLCKYILEYREFKENLKSKSALGKNACHFAAESGSVKIFQLLIAEGISPEETTSNGQNVFHIACIYGKVEMCEYISECYVDLIHKESKEGWNATLHAAKNGHTNVLKFLNAKKVSFKNKSESDRNALHISCDNGHFEACEYISENFPSLLKSVDHKGRYASHFAARSGNLKIMKYLESKTTVTQETYIGMNILHMVCLHEHIEMCKYLLERYPDLNVKRTEKGWTTAHFVAGNGNTKGKEIELFEMLINAERHVDMMLLTVNGNSVLTLAIKYNAYSFANYLFANCHRLLGIQGAIDPFDTGNEDPKMLALLEKHLGKKPR